jgi:DNA-directed RNA polymerase beta' subunit
MDGDLEGIQFGVLTDEQIRSLGVVEVTESTLHARGQPKAGGPIDTRFGTCSRFQLCATCKNTVQNCPGHPGYITLPYPLPHVAFVTYLTRVLNVFCFNCSWFLLPAESIPATARTAKTRLLFAYDEARKARARKRQPLVCLNPECCLPQPTVYMEEPFIRLMWREDIKELFLSPDAAATDDSVEPPVKKPRKRKAAQDAAEEVVALSAEEQAWRTQRLADYEQFVVRPFTNWDAYNVLRSIRKSDLAILGIDGNQTHPSGFMLLSLIVPPMAVRPTVSFEEGSKRCGYNQLTKKIAEIVKLKRALIIEASEHKFKLEDSSGDIPDSVRTSIQMLYVSIAHYMIKDKCKVPGLKMSPYAARAHARAQSVSAALNGKKGRYRDTLMGKRVNFCLRTVVTTAPDADLDEIGLPYELARRLSIPIKVNRHNRDALQQLMRDDGVMQIMDESTGDMIAVNEHNRNTLVLLDGWVVERFVRKGDWIPINRQPTLHKPSIMGHRVYIHNDRTLKLPAPCTTPYNADHDGDEMNGHIPQTPEARAEVQELMAVSKHIMHPRANKPVMAIIQDGIDASYFMTHPDTWLTRGEACALLMMMRYDRDAPAELALGDPGLEVKALQLPIPAILKPTPMWSGKQIISCVLPRLTMTRKLKNRPKYDGPEWMAPDGWLYICNGELLMGTLCKQTVGDTAGGIIHMACLYLNNNIAARFISDVQRMLNKFLISVGFSVGVKDCLTKPEVGVKVSQVLAAAERHITELINMGQEMPSDPVVQDMVEGQIGNCLKSVQNMIGNVVRAHLDEQNMFNIMTNVCGSKGSSFNLSQIMGVVGQTFVNGMRPSALGRVLPNAPLPGQTPLSIREQLETHGLILRPYKAGLSMPAAFLHNMGGREGLVDTAAKTSRTGYLQRRTVKAMESHHVGYDGSVRDAYQNVFQINFGTDGFDTTRLTKLELHSLILDDKALQARCIHPGLTEALAWQEWSALRLVRDEARKCKITNFHRNLSQNLDTYLPFTLPMLVRPCICKAPRAQPAMVVSLIQELCHVITSEVPATFTEYHIRDELGSARVHMCETCLQALCQTILTMHRDARLQPGEGIGAMTATSIGEPCTQMSAAYDTYVLVRRGPMGPVESRMIGELIDSEMYPPNGGHQVYNTTNWQCLGVSPTENVHWVDIKQFSRHPVNGNMMKVRTASGRTLCMTPSHSFLVRADNMVVPRTGSDLVVGDALPVLKSLTNDDASGADVSGMNATTAPLYTIKDWLEYTFLQYGHTSSNNRAAIKLSSEAECWRMAVALARCGLASHFVDQNVVEVPHNSRFKQILGIYEHLPDTEHDYVVPGMEKLVPGGAVLYSQLIRCMFGRSATVTKAISQALLADVFWDPIVDISMREGQYDELVYDFTVDAACQSFMLSNGTFVHNTLNSVSWETEIQLHEPAGALPVQAIGSYVDKLMAAAPESVQHQPDGAEWLPLRTPIKILSVNEHGSWSSELVEGVSRHPVRNPDGSTTVIRVTTHAGRSVIATLGESFLRYTRQSLTGAPNQTLIEVCKGSDLNVGDHLPVACMVSLLDRQNKMLGPTYQFRADMVVRIEELPEPPIGRNGTAGKMYDLTVANTKNFVLANGLAVRDTFHQAGSAKAGMTDGVPRMREIICASRNISTPFITLPLKAGLRDNEHAAEALARSLPLTLLRNILKSTDTLYEPDIHNVTGGCDQVMLEQHAPFLDFVKPRCCPWVIRFELCRTRAGARSIEPRGVADLIQEDLGDRALVISTRAQDENWVIRIYLIDTESIVERALKKSLDTTSATNASKIARRTTPNTRPSLTSRKRRKFADLSHLPHLESGEPVIPVPLHRIDPAVGKRVHTARELIEWMYVRHLQQQLTNTLRVSGMDDVQQAMVRCTDRTEINAITGAVQTVDEYVIDVKGSNFMQLAMLHAVDMRFMASNHVMVIYDTFGIDAAAHVLFQEFQLVLSTSGSRVDDRLIKLLVDVMTHHGFVMPISRHGLNRLIEHGVLAKITFEETLEMLFEAAALGHFDPLLGVSENIMVGRQPSLGTNLPKMYMQRDNGVKVPCVRGVQSSVGTNDTRVVCSVVTEDDCTIATTVPTTAATTAVSLDDALDRLLFGRGGRSATPYSMPSMLTVVAEPEAYHNQLLKAPITMAQNITAPFRPSSPGFGAEDESFRPSSPTL